MKIINLVEDTKGHSDCGFEHGLSFYVETSAHKLLVDAGATDIFIENARILGVDLRKVDTVILSHGHYDHSGGFSAFAELNPDARIYMRKTAGGDYFNGERYIGIDKSLLSLLQVIFTDDFLEIDSELTLFSDITGRRHFADSNKTLSVLKDGKKVQDDFNHEQCLVIRSEGKSILMSGCAHNGILNILDKYKSLFGGSPDVVVSGFHMMKKTEYTSEEIENIRCIARELKKENTVFYTGHCTGKAAFDIMKEIMQESLVDIHSGQILL